MIEILNQLAARGRRKPAPGMSSRQQVADAALRILGGVPLPAHAVPEGQVFGPAEGQMVGGVLSLHDRPVSAVMIWRQDVAWLDIGEAKTDSYEINRSMKEVAATFHRRAPECLKVSVRTVSRTNQHDHRRRRLSNAGQPHAHSALRAVQWRTM